MSNCDPMYRAWINQPSTLQPLHHLHGTRVLASSEPYTDGMTVVYFVSGPTVSAVVPLKALSRGDWED